jgi:hypothetical protein
MDRPANPCAALFGLDRAAIAVCLHLCDQLAAVAAGGGAAATVRASLSLLRDHFTGTCRHPRERLRREVMQVLVYYENAVDQAAAYRDYGRFLAAEIEDLPPSGLAESS